MAEDMARVAPIRLMHLQQRRGHLLVLQRVALVFFGSSRIHLQDISLLFKHQALLDGRPADIQEALRHLHVCGECSKFDVFRDMFFQQTCTDQETLLDVTLLIQRAQQGPSPMWQHIVQNTVETTYLV